MNKKFKIMLFIGALFFGFGSSSYAQYPGYQCEDLAKGYSTPATYCGTNPPSCTCTDSTNTTHNNLGPNHECSCTQYNPGTNGTYQDQYGVTNSCDCTQISGISAYCSCSITQADCTGGKTFNPTLCACVDAPACVPTPTSTPSISETSNTSGGSGSVRTQIFAIGPNMIAGDYFEVGTYSHEIYVYATSTDTASTIASKLASAVNATTSAQWESETPDYYYYGLDATSCTMYGIYYSGQNGFKPSATSSGSVLTIKLNYQNQFASYAGRTSPDCSPSPTPTTTPPSCTVGSACGPCPVGHVCTYGGGCCNDDTTLTCLATWSTCTSPSCTVGSACGPCPVGHVCTYGSGCCNDATTLTCLATWSTCTPPTGTPTPTPTSTPVPACWPPGNPTSTPSDSTNCSGNGTGNYVCNSDGSANVFQNCTNCTSGFYGPNCSTPTAVLTLNPSSIDFLSMPIGGTTTTQSVTIQNTGTTSAVNCVISGSDTTGTFNLTSYCGSNFTLGAGASCSFSLSATPQNQGNFTDNISVSCVVGTDTNAQTAVPGPGGSYKVKGVAPCANLHYPDPSGACVCPPGYNDTSGTCMPTTLTSNEFQNTGGYSSCGTNRLPVTSTLASIDVASSSFPRTTPAMINSVPYQYSIAQGTAPNQYPIYDYFAAGLTHCACAGHTVGAALVPGHGVNGVFTVLDANLLTGGPRFGGDTMDFISSLGGSGFPNKTYGQVAIAADGTSDGRSGTLYGSGASLCGCPNLNEVAKPISTSGAINGDDEITGVICKSGLSNDPNVIFAQFDPSPNGDSSQVVLPDSGSPAGSYVPTINLPISQASGTTLSLYNRHIWKCQIGYYLDPTTKKCMINQANHACGPGSPVSSTVAGLSWNNVINKKLACCMNQMDSNTLNSTQVKFDCIENSSASFKDFNKLWASEDSPTDTTLTGDQINAILLTNSGGKPVTGFYTKDGARCNEYSEFSSAPIKTGTINPIIQSSQQTSVSGTFQQSGTIQQPSSAAGWTTLLSGLSAAGKSTAAPDPATNILGALRCPILVRAAIEVTCPKNSAGTNSPHYSMTDSAGVVRCPAAETIQVHVRAEQVFTISGEAPMLPIDTVYDSKSVATISMDQILQRKGQSLNTTFKTTNPTTNAGICLPGLQPGPNGCHY